ncbi:MAG: hypothetical protein P4L51_13935 [Puia sp.]|nr:hypothetical protein [Puia sp.]
MKKNIYTLSLVLIVFQTLQAQKTATGSWYGRADVEMAGIHNNYLTELIIRQKGNKVDGIFGYYFRDKYTSFFVHGHYNPKTREIRILNIPVIYFNSNSTVNSIDCITNFQGILMVSKLKSSLSGFFYRDEKYKYTCPDLRVHYTLDKGDQKQDSVLSKATAGSMIWKPQPDDVVVNAAENNKEDSALSANRTADTGAVASVVRVDSTSNAGLIAEKTTAAVSGTTAVRVSGKTTATTPVTGTRPGSTGSPSISDTGARSQVKSDPMVASTTAKDMPTPQPAPAVDPQASAATKAKADAKAAAEKAAQLAREDAKKITESFTKRKNTPAVGKALEVETDSVRVSFYDNGVIDGDSISVFLNHRLILSHQELAAKALTIYVHLDSLKEVNEISMFAENLGKYPPNTALMVVTDGIKRYEVFMSSSLTQNASIQLRRKQQ